MKIEKDKVVLINYTLRNPEGEIIDTCEGKDPLQYVHGQGMLIAGMEKGLEGKQAGDKFQLVIQPEDGYGKVEPGNIAVVKAEAFPVTPEVGMQFQTVTGIPVKITAINGDDITVDANHALAGVELHFDVEVIEVN